MRRREKEIHDSSEIEGILKAGEVCRLGMAVENTPYVVPVTYAYEDGCIYFHSARQGRKMEMMRKNPRVCFEVTCDYGIEPGEDPCDWGARFRCVMGVGTARSIEDEGEKVRGLGVIMTRHGGNAKWVFDAKAVARTSVICIDIEEMTGKRSGGFEPDTDAGRLSAPPASGT